MTRHRLVILLGVSLSMALAARGLSSANPDDEGRARLIGTLTFSRLSIHLDEVPVREAIDRLETALGIVILGRYSDDRIGHGIDPEAPITLMLEDASARFVLEAILEQAELYDPVTWQLRAGFVEVGTKERLGAPSAIESRMYNVRDLLLEPPYFDSEDFGQWSELEVDLFFEEKYAVSALSPLIVRNTAKTPEKLIEELIRSIVEMVEPGNWDYGQFDEDEPDDRERRNLRRRRADPAVRALRSRKMASIRVWEDRLIIRAPDFIHRQVNGYPKLIPPPLLTDEERAERSEKASGESVTIRLHPSRDPTPKRPAAPEPHRVYPGSSRGGSDR